MAYKHDPNLDVYTAVCLYDGSPLCPKISTVLSAVNADKQLDLVVCGEAGGATAPEAELVRYTTALRSQSQKSIKKKKKKKKKKYS